MVSAPSVDFIQWFRDAAPYIHAHRGKTFVVHSSGELIKHPVFSGIVHDIALLNSLGIHLVLVFGARPQIEAELKARDLNPRLVNGLRATDTETLSVIKSVVGALQIDIESQFSMGLPNSPMSQASIKIACGNFVVAQPVGVIEGVDLEFTGKVRRIHTALMLSRMHNHELLLIPPIGYSLTGEVFNLSSVELAKELAIGLGADKLLFLMTEPGFKDDAGELLHHMTQLEAEQLLRGRDLSDGSLYLQLEAGLYASKQGVDRVHYIDQSQDGALMQELFSREGYGTLLTAASYDEIRRATIDDIGGILELIQPLEEMGKLVRRSREKMETEINDYFVVVRENVVIACAALHIYEEESCGELACVVVDDHYKKMNKGKELLLAVQEAAAEQHVKKLFALTTQATHWFIEQGFKESSIDELPVKKKQLYNFQRNSKVFLKQLA